jgi:N-formylglutamate deformylase
VILHIPHSSTNIPFMDGYVADRQTMDNEIFKLTDWYADDSFHFADALTIKADFSRIFRDVKRFADRRLSFIS